MSTSTRPLLGKSVVQIDGALRAPLNCSLTHHVQTLIDQGQRCVVLNLARVPDLDAAGIGELVRVHNMLDAVHGTLRIARTPVRVRRVLERVGLYDLLAQTATADSRRTL